jgi:phosphopentomutase
MEIPHKWRRRIQPSASTCAASRVGFLRTWEQVEAGEALVHDISGQRGRGRGLVPARSPHEAAAILLELLGEGDFVLFEHFLLDEAGHEQSLAQAVGLLDELDLFLRAVVAGLQPGDHLLVVSDHGNVEDVSTRSHTRNPVPFLCFGPDAVGLVHGVKSLQDVAGAVLRAIAVA